MTKMNPEIKAEWVAKLRDPSTQQTKGVLNRIVEDVVYRYSPDSREVLPVGMCCLGVLCEIAVEQGVIEHFHSDDEEPGVIGYATAERGSDRILRETGVLPREVAIWAGVNHNPSVPLPEDAPLPEDVKAERDQATLAYLNDQGTPFPVLADLIEKGL